MKKKLLLIEFKSLHFVDLSNARILRQLKIFYFLLVLGPYQGDILLEFGQLQFESIWQHLPRRRKQSWQQASQNWRFVAKLAVWRIKWRAKISVGGARQMRNSWRFEGNIPNVAFSRGLF